MIKRSLLLALLIYSLPAAAESLQFTDAWIKNLPMAVPVRAGYMHIFNNQSLEVTIVSLESKSFESIQIHQSLEVDGMMSMRPVDTLSIPAGESPVLAPGGFHLMMMNPQEQLIPGEKVAVTLHYQDRKTQTIDMVVRK
ncbi:MAG: copper chaperone PCu(A)C [Gammaproteobacteria bacterium]|nr:copper chaperone PCu(A)C [Gammaproteobacteria bacterium]